MRGKFVTHTHALKRNLYCMCIVQLHAFVTERGGGGKGGRVEIAE